MEDLIKLDDLYVLMARAMASSDLGYDAHPASWRVEHAKVAVEALESAGYRIIRARAQEGN